MFPEDIFLMTIADKNISPQVLWNAVAKKYKEIAYELMG
jgi:hypothetical protein